MSFANQALSAEYVVAHAEELEPRVYGVPEEIDREIARLSWRAWASRSTASPRSRRGTWRPGTKAPRASRDRAAGGRLCRRPRPAPTSGGAGPWLPGAAPAGDVAEAIRALAVRGAPAIGIAAAYGYALARGPEAMTSRMLQAALLASRPTAVNLPWALAAMRGRRSERCRSRRSRRGGSTRRRSSAAAAWPSHAAGLFAPGTRAFTHCNTGALETGGVGRALGAILSALEHGLVAHVLRRRDAAAAPGCAPDRLGARAGPACQTGWSRTRAAGALIGSGGSTRVLAGADRIAANGDTANKIGAYTLAVLAASSRACR